ncbi:MAG: HupE/UreJ family protein [Saprospiraceae bacterium]|nr:HupE/UreJ family protein [Saprospiraceae bacterium]
MQSEFATYFQLGIQHIADIKAYDHILFVIALCVIYKLEDWRKLLILITAFTLGHSLTLGLSALNILVFPSDVIEFLIPVTIFITAVLNLTRKNDANKMNAVNYFLPLFFGFIHGSGFSNYFRSLIGKEDSVVKPLFAFNLGIEVGQLIIESLFLAITLLVVKLIKIPHPIWSKIISFLIMILALYLMWETKFW